MSQALRAVKRFRVRELALASPKSRTPPAAATAASILHSPQRPLARAETSSASRSGTALNPFVPHKNDKSGRWAPPKYSLRRQADLVKHARASGTLHLLPPGPKMSSAQLLAATGAPTSSTSPLLPPPPASVLGEAGAEALVAENGLVSLRRGQQVQGQGQGRKEEVEEEEEEARGEAPVLGLGFQDGHAVWMGPVEWVGTVRERSVAGADVGNRLYAGKKRMFKGHKWERTRERRVARTKMLVRDMDKRVQRFKGVRYSDSTSVFISLLPPFPFWTLFADGFLFSFCALVPCQGQAIAAGEEVQRVEEDAEAAVLSA